jgi:hypothetical protein
MTRKAETQSTARPELLAFSAGVTVAVAVIYAATQWAPASAASAAEPPAIVAQARAASTECVFVNHVRQGPGHPYRQEPDEICRYEFDPAAPDQGGPPRY